MGGGQSRRMGQDKALLPFGGSTLLGWVVGRVGRICPRVLVVARDPGAYPGFEVVVDRFPGCGPLGGLHAGLLAARTEVGLCVACDLPFIEPSLLLLLLDRVRGYDAAVPLVGSRPEPLCAAYRREVAGVAEDLLHLNPSARGWSMRDLLERLRVRYVPEEELRTVDPELVSFWNVNTPQDYHAALQRVGVEAGRAIRSNPL